MPLKTKLSHRLKIGWSKQFRTCEVTVLNSFHVSLFFFNICFVEVDPLSNINEKYIANKFSFKYLRQNNSVSTLLYLVDFMLAASMHAVPE